MRRFKPKKFKRKKLKSNWHMPEDKKKKHKRARRSRAAVKEDLQEWEQEQIELAVKTEIRNKKKQQSSLLQLPGLEAPQISLTYKKNNLEVVTNDDGAIVDIKGLNVAHLKDAHGIVRYWGQLPKSLRPKPRLLPNGDRSPEDQILNPKNPPDNLPQTKRYASAQKLLRKLMTGLGYTEPRDIRGDDPKGVDSFVLSTGIELSADIDPDEQTKRKNYLLSDASGSRRFFTKKEALKVKTNGYATLLYDGPSKRFWIKRWRIIRKLVNGKQRKKLKHLETVTL